MNNLLHLILPNDFYKPTVFVINISCLYYCSHDAATFSILLFFLVDSATLILKQKFDSYSPTEIPQLFFNCLILSGMCHSVVWPKSTDQIYISKVFNIPCTFPRFFLLRASWYYSLLGKCLPFSFYTSHVCPTHTIQGLACLFKLLTIIRVQTMGHALS